ncbi:MAG TPA: MerR family transcriptional regulator [Longimicrobium sp.]
MARDGWKVGELAGATGLTVRTLHHYDEIGLLRPSRRTPSGHRLYGDGDVARLQQVTSLRELGFPLEEIRALLDRRGISPREVVGLHLERLREQIELQRALCERLERIAAQLDRAETVSADELIRTIEATTMYDNYFTPEQREELKARAAELGDDRIHAVEGEWERLMAEVRAEMDRGTDPSEPRVQALAARWMELVRGFTGGNPEIHGSLNRMWQQETTIHGIDTAPVREMMAYVQRALDAGKAS